VALEDWHLVQQQLSIVTYTSVNNDTALWQTVTACLAHRVSGTIIHQGARALSTNAMAKVERSQFGLQMDHSLLTRS
jgi:hypothetical protein